MARGRGTRSAAGGRAGRGIAGRGESAVKVAGRDREAAGVVLTVDGTPAPKGSRTAGPRRDGTVFARPASKGEAWVDAVAAKAMVWRSSVGTLEPPYAVALTFWLPRPGRPGARLAEPDRPRQAGAGDGGGRERPFARRVRRREDGGVRLGGLAAPRAVAHRGAPRRSRRAGAAGLPAAGWARPSPRHGGAGARA
jgi:hypothetical protein